MTRRTEVSKQIEAKLPTLGGRENTKSLRWMGTWGAGGTEDGHCGWSSPVKRMEVGKELGSHGGSGRGRPGWQ